uniref:Alkylglycerone-phosphate synthase n=1 Tax=Parastrongyloides trichosuri TaxID=131310 RepID=A0A0N5A1U2_PARTI
MHEVQSLNVPSSYRDTQLKWNGWGYKDSSFEINKDGDVVMTGGKYDISGEVLPNLRPYMETNLDVDINNKYDSTLKTNIKFPKPIDNQLFIDYLKENKISFTNGPQHRLIRSHGHTLHDMIMLRTGKLHRIPDIVVWPGNEMDVVRIVEAANKFNVVIIPIGGGTSVTNALSCPDNETRSICSLDMALMDKIQWIDEKNFLVKAEAGIVGQVLERELAKKGYTCGHEPDSVEFSTLGGWISTRASGMKKNRYGNIEDLLIHVNMVTSKGILSKSCSVPRMSAGPDIHQIILGSEGMFGVITSAVIKIFPLPEVKKFGSIVFPNFKYGVGFFREVAKQRIQPASLRLVDNQQFQMGQAMKTQTSYWKTFTSSLAKFYVTKIKGFKVDEIVVATCVFEGSRSEVDIQEKRIYLLASNFHGIEGGEENGKYGYRLTFAIAYLRDLAMDYGVIGESFETSCPWDKVEDLCRNVKIVIQHKAKECGITTKVLASCRVTQVYDSGVCIYFYFAFNYKGLKNPVEVYDTIEAASRDEILACGGSISHHHGVAKIRKHWLPQTIGINGVSIINSLKEEMDPNNIFGADNLITKTSSKL